MSQMPDDRQRAQPPACEPRLKFDDTCGTCRKAQTISRALCASSTRDTYVQAARNAQLPGEVPPHGPYWTWTCPMCSAVNAVHKTCLGPQRTKTPRAIMESIHQETGGVVEHDPDCAIL